MVVDTKPPTVECVPIVRHWSRRDDDDDDRGGRTRLFKVFGHDLCSPTVAMTLGNFPLTNGDTIRIKLTRKPGVRMGKNKAGHVPTFEVGPGQNVIKGTDASGNTASAVCLIPPAPKEHDDDRQRVRARKHEREHERERAREQGERR